MTKELFFQAIAKFFVGAAVVCALIFLSAGTLDYWNGWLLMAILFIPMFFVGIVMMVKSPELLRKRLSVREKEAEQGKLIRLSGCMFVGGFLAAGLSFRFQFLLLPPWASWAAAALFLLAYALYGEVLRENAYLSRTVEVQEGQKVIDTGLYGMVRHPMYSVTLLLFLSVPFVLGAWLSVPLFLAYPAIIVSRIKNEEEVLKQGLEGYTDYMGRVRYRLIPYIW